MIKYKRLQPCEHKGCLSHFSHLCEGCGRTMGEGVVYEDEDFEFTMILVKKRMIKELGIGAYEANGYVEKLKDRFYHMFKDNHLMFYHRSIGQIVDMVCEQCSLKK